MDEFKLIEIFKLKDFLGYRDLRAVRNWCKHAKIPIIPLGKKEYVSQDMLEIAVFNEKKKAMIANGTSENKVNQLLSAILADNKGQLAGIMLTDTKEGHIFQTKSVSSCSVKLENMVADYKNKVK